MRVTSSCKASNFGSLKEIRNSSHVIQITKHPIKKMFLGCFSYYGLGLFLPMTGMMRNEKYQSILVKRMIAELKNDKGVLQQDLAPYHTSKKMVKFFSGNHMIMLDWPRNSPDININRESMGNLQESIVYIGMYHSGKINNRSYNLEMKCGW